MASHSLLGASRAAGQALGTALGTALVTALGTRKPRASNPSLLETALVTALGTRKPRASNPADGVTRAGAPRWAPGSVGVGTGGRLPNSAPAELGSGAAELRTPGPPPRAVLGPRLSSSAHRSPDGPGV